MALAYTAPSWTDGSGTGISASQLQALCDCIEGLVQGTDKAIHNIAISGSTITLTFADGSEETRIAGVKGISSIAKTGTSGLVDTYTITYTDGTTSTFTVTNGVPGTDNNAYHVDDTAEVALDDADYVPFYDSSASEKRKSLWSNIKSVLKTYFDTLYTLTDFGSTGTASASAVSYQRIKKGGSWYEIKGTKYMETSTKTTSSGTDTFTFTNADILTTSAIDVYADVFGVAPTAVTVSSGSCAVSFNSSDSVTICRIYIK